MPQLASILAAHPRANHTPPLAATLAQALDCSAVCRVCADACLAEEALAALRECIRLNLDCADLCAATASVLSRNAEGPGEVARALIEACVLACVRCAEECERHAERMEHCRVCAESCRACEAACRSLLQQVAPVGT